MCLKRGAFDCIDLAALALQLVLLIRGVDDFSSRQRVENRIQASLAHFCLLCSKWDTIVLCILSFRLEWDDMYGLLSQVRPNLCTFVLSIRLRVVIHDKQDLWEIDHEYLLNVHLGSRLSYSISSTHSRPYGVLCTSVLPYRAPWWGPLFIT